MNKALQRRIGQLIEAEMEKDIDGELLNKLREFASQETDYWNLAPERRNTLNEFFKEVKELLFGELMAGRYGSQIILDAIIVLSFEVGYRLKEWEAQFPEPPIIP